MSREIEYNLGSREPTHLDVEMLRYLVENVRDGDTVRVKGQAALTAPAPLPTEDVVRGASEPDNCKVPNEQAAQKFNDAALAHLEDRNDAQDQSKPETASVDASRKAGEIARAQRGVVDARAELNKAGIKVVVEGILRKAWEGIVAAWEYVQAFF